MIKFLNILIIKIILKYSAFGLLAAVIEFVFFIYLIKFFELIIANSFSYFCGMLVSFTLNSLYNFQTKNKKIIRFSKFVTVNFLAISLSYMFVYFLNHHINKVHVAKLISIPLVVVIQFLANYFWTFKKYK